ncbi:hypothetical protein HMPREF1548_04316 [Clostridium sp. KLE 1755]|nr:hypothetical protein HMPREF1548_04316 [Clostridium sp. KLE 1755]
MAREALCRWSSGDNWIKVALLSIIGILVKMSVFPRRHTCFQLKFAGKAC